jgi:Ca-activated chloride channel homolog
MSKAIGWWATALSLLFFVSVGTPQASAAGLLVATGGLGGKLKIVEQDVHVTINNGIAVTQIDQVFLNTENRIVEALYTFPVPNGASVSNFTMIINGKEMVGEVVEKQRARQIYESYKSQRRDPGLLEQVSYKAFELRVFPIAAGAQQRISITYYQQLTVDHNQATYVYPLATTTDGSIDAKTMGKFGFTIDVKSEIPIVELRSPSHKDDFVITSPTANYTRASLEVTEGDLNKDVVINYDLQRAQTGIDFVTSKRQGEDGYFMLSMTAGKELEEVASGMDYLFVIDISGSMANDGKLNLSRTAVEGFVEALGSDDRFNLLTFNNTPALQSDQLQAVDAEAKSRARQFLLEQRARGGTALRPALLTAFKFKDSDRPLNVVVLSDGMTEVAEQRELLAAIGQAPAGTRVFCVGIGNDINRPLLKQVAEGAGGLAAFISHQDDFGRQAQSFRRKLMRPVATNVKIKIEGVEAFDIANEQLPDLYYGAPIGLIGRYKQAGQAQVTITAEVLGQPFEQTVKLNFADMNEKNPEIERMWAFQRVQELMNQSRKNGQNAEIVDKIVQLCEGYSIVSEYASFIVLENDAEYVRWSINRRNLTRSGRDRAAQAALRTELESMREEALAKLGPPTEKLVTTQSASSGSQNAAQPSPQASPTVAQQPVDNSSAQDLNFSPSFNSQGGNRGGGGGGGGAIDPITGMLALSVAGASAWAARRRKQASRSE